MASEAKIIKEKAQFFVIGRRTNMRRRILKVGKG